MWRVSPLPIVDPDGIDGADDAATADAVRLFVERARSASPQFELTDENAGDVARIVAQVNGIPLAIELAAAALGDRPISGVLEGLTDRFSLLTRGRRTAPPRHQTLRAALEWSLDLLQTDERRLFARLAAFASGGTTEAIAEVCGGLPGAGGDVARSLRHLARASLLVPHAELPERWSMLESVRQLAAIELEELGEDDELAARHRTWFADRVGRVEPGIGRRGQPQSGHLVGKDNVRVRSPRGSLLCDDAVTFVSAPRWHVWTFGRLRRVRKLRAGAGLPRATVYCGAGPRCLGDRGVTCGLSRPRCAAKDAGSLRFGLRRRPVARAGPVRGL